MSRDPIAKALAGTLFESVEHGSTRSAQVTALEAAERLGLTKGRASRTIAAAARELELPFRAVRFRPMQEFQRDLEHFGVLRATKEELAAQRRMMHRLRVEHLRELAARNPGFYWLGMPEKKARTLGALLDHELGRGMAAQGGKLAQEAQAAARGLSEELLAVWNDALPPGENWTPCSMTR